MSDEPEYVGQKDDHTGVGDNFGVPYTYSHVEEGPEFPPCVYRFLSVHPNGTLADVSYVGDSSLDSWMYSNLPMHGRVVDVRPLPYEEIEADTPPNEPVTDADGLYVITGVIDYVNRPMHRNRYLSAGNTSTNISTERMLSLRSTLTSGRRRTRRHKPRCAGSGARIHE